MNKLEHIRAFITVVEENSFVGAANYLGVSTAAISRQVTALEKYLGAQLLRRTTRSVTLTETGIEYYQLCKSTLENLQEAEQSILNNQTEASGVLRVIATRSLAFSMIHPNLSTFLAQNPKLQIDLEIAERIPNLAEEGIDIIFGVSVDISQDLVRRRIMDSHYTLCASPNYLKKNGYPNTPSELQHHNYITHSNRKPIDILRFKDSKEMYIEPILKVNDTASMQTFALQGMGIVKLQEYEVKQALNNGSLIEILKEYRTPSFPIYLYYQQTKYLSGKIRRFIDFFLDSL
jgi:DNA-binding transcriptional LysR family regulator